jgi:hypothetical protein
MIILRAEDARVKLERDFSELKSAKIRLLFQSEVENPLLSKITFSDFKCALA